MQLGAGPCRVLATLGLVWALSACQTTPQPPTESGADCRPPDAGTTAALAAAQALATPAGHAGAPRTSSPSPGPSLALQGQLSVKLEAFGDRPAKGLSLGFFFNGRAIQGDMALMTLMGSQVAQLKWSPVQAELTDDQGPHRYPNLAALSQAALGEALPLDTLIHWMQGRADPDLPVQAGGEPDTFEQLGWLIDTRQMDQKKLSATRPASPSLRGVRIKVYLDR